LHPPPRSRPLWNNLPHSTTTADPNHGENVEKYHPNTYDDNLVKRHDDNSAINSDETQQPLVFTNQKPKG
jgi:hypothetical protein